MLVFLHEYEKERLLSGVVTTVGPGRYDATKEGKRAPMKVGGLWI